MNQVTNQLKTQLLLLNVQPYKLQIMITMLDKETHVFLKKEGSFTSISKRKNRGTHQVYTTEKLTSEMADQINSLFGANLEVVRVHFEKGFILIKLKPGGAYKNIVQAIKTVLYGEG